MQLEDYYFFAGIEEARHWYDHPTFPEGFIVYKLGKFYKAAPHEFLAVLTELLYSVNYFPQYLDYYCRQYSHLVTLRCQIARDGLHAELVEAQRT